jgi:TPR repeat protein
MISADILFRQGDDAERAERFDLALQCFERGAALGDADCFDRLGMMYDVGRGVAIDKSFAMRCYQRAWRRGSQVAANNIAILYREVGDQRAMFRWFKRAAEPGDGDAHVELAKCYMDGSGVRKSLPNALRQLNAAVNNSRISDDSLEEARALLAAMRPYLVEKKPS